MHAGQRICGLYIGREFSFPHGASMDFAIVVYCGTSWTYIFLLIFFLHSGQVITVKVEITASHEGYFEFRLCPKLEGEEGDDDLTKCYQDPAQYRLLQLTDGKTRAHGNTSGKHAHEKFTPLNLTFI